MAHAPCAIRPDRPPPTDGTAVAVDEEHDATPEQADLLVDLVDWVGSAWASGERPRVARWLGVKLVLGSQRELLAKAYLGYRVDWNPLVVGY